MQDLAQTTSDTSDTSDSAKQQLGSKQPFPLASLLQLYMRAKKADVYCDYMHGFRCLVQWLSPIAIPEADPEFKFKPLLYNYEQQELAKILNTTPHIIQQTLTRIYENDSK